MFSNNKANVGGAIKITEKKPSNLINNIYSNNYAFYYGENYASNPCRIGMLNNQNNISRLIDK